MILYHEVRGCSLAVDIVARELSIPLHIEWVDMQTKTLSDGRSYYEINSKGTVPTLDIDGVLLSEGSVITQYLADQKPESGLIYASGTMERYRILEWLSFIAADLHKGGFMPLFKQITPASYRQIATSYVQDRLAWLDSQLSNRTFLVGERFTIADAHCYTIASWAKAHDIACDAWPNLTDYLQRIGARSSVCAAKEAARLQGVRQASAASDNRHSAVKSS